MSGRIVGFGSQTAQRIRNPFRPRYRSSFQPAPGHSAPIKPERMILVALVVVYVSLLVWIVLWKLEVPFIGVGATRNIKLIPFLSTAEAGPSAPGEVAANVFLFVPFGLYLGMLKPTLHAWASASVVAGSSLLLEVIQYVLAIGVADITDVLANTAGGVMGVGLYRLSRRALTVRTDVVLRWVCLVGTVVALFACVLVVASSLRYAPPMHEPPGLQVRPLSVEQPNDLDKDVRI